MPKSHMGNPGQQLDVPSAANLAAREWFRNAKFGMFVSWSVSSLLEGSMWAMELNHRPIAEYEKLAERFNPVQLDSTALVALARTAGMRYITFTAKHHDGFAMFGTKQSDWNIVDRTPFGRDAARLLADECARQGIKLFFYYSQMDWHHPDYYPLGRFGHHAGRPPGGAWSRYLEFMDDQVRELLTNYGEVAGIWFDGWEDRIDADWRLEKTYRLIHQLQPAALVGTNCSKRLPIPGEDFQIFERLAKFLTRHKPRSNDLPWEVCDTIGDAWAYGREDVNLKSAGDLIRCLVRVAGQGANLLLDVGPMPTGAIRPEFVERLTRIGEWTRRNGESIYGTRGGPIAPRPWGVTTRKGNRVYLHILDWQDTLLALPRIEGRIVSARRFPDGDRLTINDAGQGLVLTLPEGSFDPVDTIVELELA